MLRQKNSRIRAAVVSLAVSGWLPIRIAIWLTRGGQG